MAEFVVNDILLTIPDRLLTEQLRASFTSGRYESSEADALVRHLRPRDRYLDLGAGAGFLLALAGAKLGVAGVAGVEAGPDMVPVAIENLRQNGVDGAKVHWGAIVPDSFANATVAFLQRRSFWASSLTPPVGAANTTAVEVPALRFGALLEAVRPTVASIDIEGGELELFATPLPACLRLIVMELHPAVYGKAGIKQVFDALSQQGFAYCPIGSKGGTVVFERLKTPG